MPKHIRAETDCYFVTTNSAGRIPLFADSDIASVVIQALYQIRSQGRIKLHAFALMPDHLHFVATLTAGRSLSEVMHSLKSYTAKEINRRMGSRGKVWQSGFYSHGVRNEEDLLEKAKYIAANPIRAGLCEAPEEYGYSSTNEAFLTDEW